MAELRSSNPNPSQPNPEEHDPLAKALGPSKVEAFIEEHKSQLLIGLAVLIAVVVGTIIVVYQHQANRLAAAQSFTSASTLAEFNQVIDQQAGTVDGGNAMLRKAALLQGEGKIEEARSTLILFRDQYPKHPRLAQAFVMLGQMAENGGDRPKAKDFYQQVPGDSDLAPLARMRLGDLLFQEGRVAEAREAYTEIEREFAENPWSAPLKERIKEVNLVLNKPEWPSVVPEKVEPPAPPAKPAQPEAGKPGEATPAPKPAEAKPVAPAPAAPQPAQPKPAETKPAAPAPAAPQPAQPKPAETKPAAPAPAAPQPAQPKPAETKPAAPAP